jgi:hypothetical protein
VLASTPVVAQNGSDGGGALADVIVTALQETLRVVFSPVEGLIEQHAADLVRTVVGTPAPDAAFDDPSNGVWPSIYDYYWNAVVPLSLLLWALSAGLIIFFESTSHLFASYSRSKLQKRAFTGLMGILSWWWIDALARQFVHGLSTFLVPDLSQITLFETLSFSTMGVLGIVIALSTDFALFVLIALIYFARHVVLFLFTLLMPILIALWVPGVGPFSLVSGLMKRLAGFYVPFLFMTIPVAVLFRLGDLLGAHFELSMGGLGAWLTALVIPFVAVAAPLVLFWQAGALFFVADRASRRVSTRRARTNLNRVGLAGRTTAHGGRNLSRGLRGRAALRRDGQMVLNSGSSRAHAAGSQLHAAGGKLRNRLTGDHPGENAGTAAPTQSAFSSPESRAKRADTLRNRTQSRSAEQVGQRDRDYDTGWTDQVDSTRDTGWTNLTDTDDSVDDSPR